MTVQTRENEICRVDGETVTIVLPSTTLILTMEEADTLNCILHTDLIHDFCEMIHGEEQGETIWIADVPIPRSEAWRLHRRLENIVFRGDESVVDEAGWIETENCFYQDRMNWLEEGF